MKIYNKIFLAISIIITILSCNKKNNDELSLERIKYNNNTNAYPKTQMDSAQVIKTIITQKTQELLDLSALYSSGNRDTDIDSAVYSQMESYFYKPDSLTFKALLFELDSMKVKSAKLESLDVYSQLVKKDTLNYAKLNIEYFDEEKRSLGMFHKTAQYILVPYPVKFKKEFKFYFINFYNKSLNDSTSVGTTK